MKNMNAIHNWKRTVTIFLSCFILVLCFSNLALAGPKVVKIAHAEAEIDIIQSPYMVWTSIFKQIVESSTAGRYEIQVFPNKQLGDLRSMVEQSSKGIIEIVTGVSVGLLTGFASEFQVVEIPYLFQNTEIGRIVMNGQFGQELSNSMAKKSGISILTYIPSAFRNFSNNKHEIRSPADMKGLKIRIQEIPIHIAMVNALGASATPISWQELYSALQTGVVDGQENAPYVMILGKLQEVQKFYTLDNHLLNMPCSVINDKFYQGLSKEDRRIFDYAAREATFAFLGIVKAKEALDLEVIAKAGVKIYQPTPVEFAQFKDKTREPLLKLMNERVDPIWINKLLKAVDEAERSVGLK